MQKKTITSLTAKYATLLKAKQHRKNNNACKIAKLHQM